MRRLPLLAIACIVCTWSVACSRTSDDTTPPWATPTMTLNRTDASVGAPIDITYRFAVAQNAQPPGGDYLVFVHFQGQDGELLWTDDHQPERPLAQWKPGDTVEYMRTTFVPKVSYVGPIVVNVGIYSPKTGDRLPLSGQAVSTREYRVAGFNIRQTGNDVFLVYKSGWHEAEVADAASGIEWQWSKKEGLLSFRNPKRDIELFLDVDQPVTAISPAQHVELHIGPTVVDSFDLPPGQRMLRRLRLNPAQLGSADTVELGVAVDRTLVPASIPAMKSGDSRELGIRVFHAYVEPK
jgi:hypothetical protein